MQDINIGQYGNIFELPQNGEAVCVTTNGIVKSDGHAVMGAGIAKEADRYFHLSAKLGTYIKQYGNRAFNLGLYQRHTINNPAVFNIFSFPTKHHWKEDSDINLIVKSAEQLVEMCNKFNISKCYLTPPGCGCGNLNYEATVKPWIEIVLDNRFVVVHRK